MTKAELIAAVARRAGYQRAQIEAILDTLADEVSASIRLGNECPLPGLGRLKPNYRAARAGRNPKTGEPITIQPRYEVKYSPAGSLLQAINA